MANTGPPGPPWEGARRNLFVERPIRRTRSQDSHDHEVDREMVRRSPSAATLILNVAMLTSLFEVHSSRAMLGRLGDDKGASVGDPTHFRQTISEGTTPVALPAQACPSASSSQAPAAIPGRTHLLLTCRAPARRHPEASRNCRAPSVQTLLCRMKKSQTPLSRRAASMPRTRRV